MYCFAKARQEVDSDMNDCVRYWRFLIQTRTPILFYSWILLCRYVHSCLPISRLVINLISVLCSVVSALDCLHVFFPGKARLRSIVACLFSRVFGKFLHGHGLSWRIRFYNVRADTPSSTSTSTSVRSSTKNEISSVHNFQRTF